MDHGKSTPVTIIQLQTIVMNEGENPDYWWPRRLALAFPMGKNSRRTELEEKKTNLTNA